MLYVEGAGWVYKWDRYGFDKTQLDTTGAEGFPTGSEVTLAPLPAAFARGKRLSCIEERS
jgi:hypothetical protein